MRYRFWGLLDSCLAAKEADSEVIVVGFKVWLLSPSRQGLGNKPAFAYPVLPVHRFECVEEHADIMLTFEYRWNVPFDVKKFIGRHLR